MLRVDLGSGDVGVDESFDRYARIVRRALDVPVALVSRSVHSVHSIHCDVVNTVPLFDGKPA